MTTKTLTSYAARYTFSAKEKDEETGYSYFGARYYNSDLSVWLSVDPMADKYPSLSPYAYCANNPVMLVDPDGMKVINGYKQQRENAEKDVENAMQVKNRLINEGLKGTRDYRIACRNLRQAKHTLNQVIEKYNLVEEAINDVKKYAPEIYEQADNLSNGNSPVDIYVTLNYSLVGRTGQCITDGTYLHPTHSGFWIFKLSDLQHCISSLHAVMVEINPQLESDLGLTLVHEFGHLLYSIPNMSEYKKWLESNRLNIPEYSGHHREENNSDQSGLKATECEDLYKNRKLQ